MIGNLLILLNYLKPLILLIILGWILMEQILLLFLKKIQNCGLVNWLCKSFFFSLYFFSFFLFFFFSFLFLKLFSNKT